MGIDRKELSKILLSLDSLYAEHRGAGEPVDTEAEFLGYMALTKVRGDASRSCQAVSDFRHGCSRIGSLAPLLERYVGQEGGFCLGRGQAGSAVLPACNSRITTKLSDSPAVQTGHVVNNGYLSLAASPEGLGAWLLTPRLPAKGLAGPPVAWALAVSRAVDAGAWAEFFALMRQATHTQACFAHLLFLEARRLPHACRCSLYTASANQTSRLCCLNWC